MKKVLIVLTLVLALGIGSMVVYGDSGKSEIAFPGWHHENISEESREEWFNARNKYREEALKEALGNGTITEEKAKEWEEHFEYEDDFHNKNGYIGGGCGSSRGHGMMKGHGAGGMMRGHRF